jgi:hypothetical protein
MTAMHGQMSSTLEAVRRTAAGHPLTPRPMPQNNGYGTPPAQYPGYGPPGGFTPNMRR